MKILIVICLLIVIVLMLQDKIAIKKRPVSNPGQERNVASLPDIMGKPKPIRSQSESLHSSKSQIASQRVQADSFAKEIPQEELDDVFGKAPNFEEEEEDWKLYREPNGQDGFATGVTFEELSTAGKLLEQSKLEPSLEKQAVNTVQKIEGTELLDLLENSMEGASKRIAELLDRSLSFETKSDSSALRKKDSKDFDIGEFV